MVTCKEKITRMPLFADLPGRILRKRVAERAVVPAFVPGPHCPSHGVVFFVGFFPHLAWTGWALQINGFPDFFSRGEN